MALVTAPPNLLSLVWEDAQQWSDRRALTLAEQIDETQKERDHVEFLIAETTKHQDLAKQYLPRLIGNDSSLTELDLARSHVTDVSAGSLADALKANTTVTRLNLADNYIGREGCLTLVRMLEQNTTLIELNLSGTRLDDVSAEAMLAVLTTTNHTLSRLGLESTPALSPEAAEKLRFTVRINHQPPGLKRTLAELQQGQLRVIDLSCKAGPLNALPADSKLQELENRRLDDFSASVLASALRGNHTVVTLKLCDNLIGDEGACQLAFMLESNETLEEIDLFGNVVGAKGADAFIEVLMDRNHHLTKLSLNNNAVSQDLLVDLEFALVLNRQPLNLKRFLIPLREDDPALVELKFDEHLSQRFYDDVSARILADALSRNHHLTSLDLPNNRITEVGARFLADMLLVNTTLRHLNLHNNVVGGGAQWLAGALQVNATLRSLVLSNNDIDDQGGGTALAEMLAVNSGLVELDLQCNRLRHSGAGFARALLSNTVIQQLFVEGNSLSDMHMRDIQQGRLMNQEPVLLRQTLPLLYPNRGAGVASATPGSPTR
eukprot:RCo000943